jgi:hypothetical protein
MGSGYELARALNTCIRAGHPPDTAWGYTPRQLKGWVEIIGRDDLAAQRRLINAFRAAQGDGKAVKDYIKKLDEQSQ